MANEATLVYELEHPIPFTVANDTGIEKGCLLKLSDPMTASAHAAENDIAAGIASTEKIANDGVVKLGVFRRGIFKVTASGSITAGDALALADAGFLNCVYTAAVTCSGSQIIGYALETATTGETFLMDLNIGSANGVRA